MAKTKIAELDYLRGLAIIAIVMQHTMGYINHPQAGLGDVVILSVIWHLIRFGVPVFILISGATLFCNYSSLENFTYLKYLAKRVMQVLVPYLLWTIFYYYFKDLQLNGDIWQETTNIFYYFLTGRASYHLWFIVMIFQYYLLFPLFQKALLGIKARVKTAKGFHLAMAIFFLFFLLMNWFYVEIVAESGKQEGISVLYDIFAEYSYLLGILWLFYFVLGGLVGLYPTRSREWVGRIAPYNLLLWLVLLFYLLYNYSNVITQLPVGFMVNINALPLYRPIVIIFVIASLINMYRICVWLTDHHHNIFSRLLRVTSKYSFSIYLAHPFVLDLLAKEMYDLPGYNPSQKFFLTVIKTIVIIIAGTIVVEQALSYLKYIFKDKAKEMNKLSG